MSKDDTLSPEGETSEHLEAGSEATPNATPETSAGELPAGEHTEGDLDFETSESKRDKYTPEETRERAHDGVINKWEKKVLEDPSQEKNIPKWAKEEVLSKVDKAIYSDKDDAVEERIQEEFSKRDDQSDKKESMQILDTKLEKAGLTSKEFKEEFWGVYVKEMKTLVDTGMSRVEALPRVLSFIGFDKLILENEHEELGRTKRSMNLPGKGLTPKSYSQNSTLSTDDMKHMSDENMDKFMAEHTTKKKMPWNK